MSPGDWVNRLADSIRAHETDRRKATSIHPRYRILEEIGRGGMGVVYRALDPQLGREVALKVLLDGDFSNAETRERFLREAQLAARVSHPNIVPVYDSGEHEGHVYLAMQFVEGRALDRAHLDVRTAVTALRDAARAVHHAHAQGIIHRDLKPSNLMVDREGRVYVMDFGLAKQVRPGATLTLSGTIVGTPAYMPPEQARGQATDARSDVYALGATLYEVLTGTAPFSGTTPFETVKAVTLEEPVPPRRHNPQISKGLEAVVIKAMDKKPEGRYATAEAFAADLQRWLDGEPVVAPVRGTLYRVRKKAVRHRWRVISAVSSIALVAALAYLVFKPPPDPRIEQAFERLTRGDLEGAASLAAALDAEGVSSGPFDALQKAIAHERGKRVAEWLSAFVAQVVAARFDDAVRILGEMEALDPCQEDLRKARDLLDAARDADRRVRDLAGRARAALDEGELGKADQLLDELKKIALPAGLESFKPKVDATGLLELQLKSEIVTRLRVWKDADQEVPAAAPILKRHEKASYDSIVNSFPPLKRRRLEAEDPTLTAGQLDEMLIEMEKIDPSHRWTLDVTDRLFDRLDRDRAELPPDRRRQLAFEDARGAFRSRAGGRLRKLQERLQVPSDGGWLEQFEKIERVTDSPETVKAERKRLGMVPLDPLYRPDAAAFLKTLDDRLEAADRVRLAKEFAEAVDGRNLDKARDLRAQLGAIPGAAPDLGTDKALLGLKAVEDKLLAGIRDLKTRLESGMPSVLKQDLEKLRADSGISRTASEAFRTFEIEVALLIGLENLRSHAVCGDVSAFEKQLQSLDDPSFRDRPQVKRALREAHLDLARALLDRSDAAGAETWLSRAPAFPAEECWKLYDLRGLTRRVAKEREGANAYWESALDSLGKTLEARPDSAELLVARAWILWRLDRFEEAYCDAKQAGTPEAAVLRFLGALHGNPADREKRLKEAEERLDAPGHRAWRGLCRFERGGRKAGSPEADGALDDFKAASVGGALAIPARYKLAMILTDRGQPEHLAQAIDHLDTLLKAPASLGKDDLVFLGYDREGLTRSESADRFRRDSFLLRAKAHLGRKDYEKCLPDCESAIRIDSRFALAHLWKATAHHSRRQGKDLELALEEYNKVLKLPSSTRQERERASQGIQAVEQERKAK